MTDPDPTCPLCAGAGVMRYFDRDTHTQGEHPCPRCHPTPPEPNYGFRCGDRYCEHCR